MPRSPWRTSHGARKNAANSIEDIKRVVDFAHPFGARVYVTVNTIIFDNELKKVEKLTWELYRTGVDALIVQDMAMLSLELPPIALHASTQCDTRTPEKARFLQDVGFSQIVLARELTLSEIHGIYDKVSVPIECFIHGALCVSYSGRCHASQAVLGRSANRGECAQICRLPFDLKDSSGKTYAEGKHLLSLKDFNTSSSLESLLKAGASSLKIEGRLKDATYVKNVVAAYRQRLDAIISRHPDKYERASFGYSEITFNPQLDKSFNRGFTTYFLDSRQPQKISSPLTPKSMGEAITDIRSLNNGDGISFFNKNGEYEGVMVNGIKDGKIIGNRPFVISKGSEIHRTLDNKWQKTLSRPTATRKMWVDISITPEALLAEDERGVKACIPIGHTAEPAKTPQDYVKTLGKLGNSRYYLRNFSATGCDRMFYPASVLTDARRRLIEALDKAWLARYPYDYRNEELKDVLYPTDKLDYRDNVANRLAEEFYRRHGVTEIERAIEVTTKGNTTQDNSIAPEGRLVMTTRHCILRETGMCSKRNPEGYKKISFPLSLTSGKISFHLKFNCRRCEMEVWNPRK